MQGVPSVEKEEERGKGGTCGKATKGTAGEEAGAPHKGKGAGREKKGSEASRGKRDSVP